MFPGAPTTAAFWRDLVEGRDRITEVPKTHWLGADYFAPKPGTPDKVYTTRGGFLSEVDFSPAEFGLPPNALPAVDTAQLLSLLVAKRVLAEATRGRYESMDRSRISVILGVASATELVAHMSGRLQLPIVERAMRAGGLGDAEVERILGALRSCYVPWQENTFPGLLGNVVAGRIANRLDLGGTNTVLDAACAGSLAAVAMAASELALGTADMVITGGVDTLNDILMFMCFAQTGALSLTGDCRPFSSEADGTMLGEGIGLFALRRLVDAERDGDPIYAVLCGIGTSSDGKGTSIYAPSARGQVKALQRAYEQAGIRPDTIGLVEAHGTGTRAGDAAELEALLEVFAGVREEQCAIGSVKSQIGHTKAAAGAAGLAKAVLALHHKVLPPTIKVQTPAPMLAERNTPFYVNTQTRPWIAAPHHARRAAVSALGFGGTNFHLVLEEYAGATRPPRLRALPTEMVALSAGDTRALADLCGRETGACDGAGALVHLAHRSQLAFDPAAPARLAFVAADEEDARRRLLAAAAHLHENGVNPLPGIHLGNGAAAGPVAFLFPGQGSQYAGMGADLAVHFDAARAFWDETAALDELSGEPLHARVFPIPVFSDEARARQEARLMETEWAQPALAGTSLSMLALLRQLELRPMCVGGHSLGEVTALAAAGALSPLDGIRVAQTRGALMAEASRASEGAMLAVASDASAVARLLEGWNLPLSIANHNAPDQIVLSGRTDAIREAATRLTQERITTRPLAVATAFHSPVVAEAAGPFQRALDAVTFHPVDVPVYSNVTAAPYPAEARQIREQLAAAVAQPVRFAEMIDAMHSAGARTFVEVGPETVLTRLVRRCLGDKSHQAIALDQPRAHGITAFFQGLAALCAAGVPMRLEALWQGQSLPEDPTRRTSAALQVKISGANFARPYPQNADELMSKAKPSDAEPIPATQVMAPPPPAPAAVGMTAPRTAADGDTHAALRDLHAPLIAAQMEYERLMTESHTAFLRTIEASYAALAPNSAAAPPPRSPAPNLPPRIAPPPAVVRPALAPLSAPIRPAAPPTPAATPSSPPQFEVRALMPLVLEIVAEKTGYPVEMIEPTMDLESELGIDSIKRVEILAALRDRVPALPEADPAQLSKLRTLDEIVRFYEPGGSRSPAETPPKKV
jgi:polyketide-type polyunsaturated fatty acid synthase PfaA